MLHVEDCIHLQDEIKTIQLTQGCKDLVFALENQFAIQSLFEGDVYILRVDEKEIYQKVRSEIVNVLTQDEKSHFEFIGTDEVLITIE